MAPPLNLDDEAKVTVNGVELTSVESMTMRVAITAFAVEMATEGLGNDEVGQAIAVGYRTQCASILRKMLRRVQ